MEIQSESATPKNLKYFYEQLHLDSITIFVKLGLFRHFETFCYKYKNMDKVTQILENVVRCKYFDVGVHIKMV